MPKIGDLIPYFDSAGNEKPAVITLVHDNGDVDLHILTPNARRVPTRTWIEPGCATVIPELGEPAAAGPALPSPTEYRKPINHGDVDTSKRR